MCDISCDSYETTLVGYFEKTFQIVTLDSGKK